MPLKFPMITHIQQQIQDTIKEIVHIERVEKQLAITKEELDDAVAEQQVLMQKLSKELKDIEKLDGLSTKAIFYKILGSNCLLYTSPSPRDQRGSRMPSSA